MIELFNEMIPTKYRIILSKDPFGIFFEIDKDFIKELKNKGKNIFSFDFIKFCGEKYGLFQIDFEKDRIGFDGILEKAYDEDGFCRFFFPMVYIEANKQEYKKLSILKLLITLDVFNTFNYERKSKYRENLSRQIIQISVFYYPKNGEERFKTEVSMDRKMEEFLANLNIRVLEKELRKIYSSISGRDDPDFSISIFPKESKIILHLEGKDCVITKDNKLMSSKEDYGITETFLLLCLFAIIWKEAKEEGIDTKY